MPFATKVAKGTILILIILKMCQNLDNFSETVPWTGPKFGPVLNLRPKELSGPDRLPTLWTGDVQISFI